MTTWKKAPTKRRGKPKSRKPATRRVIYLTEPLLEFGFGQKLTYPRDGLFLFGPCDAGAGLSQTRFGVIGTPEGVRCFNNWSRQMTGLIQPPEPGPRSRAIEPQHVPFPGYAEAFRSEWSLQSSAVIDDLDPVEIDRTLHLGNRHEAIHNTVSMYVSRLIQENNRLESLPAFWFVVVPEIVYQLGRPQSKVPKALRTSGTVTISRKQAEELKVQPSLFSREGEGAEVYEYATDFRRQLKARLLKDRIVTQIVRETTLAPNLFLKETGVPVRRVEHLSTIAWKLGTGAYYKGGGKPWQLADVRDGVCYVGLVYKRSELSSDLRHACCAAQMFLTDGEGVVFRGALGPWFHTDSRQFHLDAPAAKRLVEMVIEEYKREHDGPPTELFIHASSAFTDEEWQGFQSACERSTNIVCVQIKGAHDDLKLYRPGAYPVIRGTALLLDERSAYLWTSGYVPRLDTYMGPETPNPIYVRIQRGTCEIGVVLKDILGLTKINFNTCLNNDGMPVTIRFANEVGDVLIAAPQDSEPRLPFKFYI
jgi:hypothetical protein